MQRATFDSKFGLVGLDSIPEVEAEVEVGLGSLPEGELTEQPGTELAAVLAALAAKRRERERVSLHSLKKIVDDTTGKEADSKGEQDTVLGHEKEKSAVQL